MNLIYTVVGGGRGRKRGRWVLLFGFLGNGEEGRRESGCVWIGWSIGLGWQGRERGGGVVRDKRWVMKENSRR